MNVGTAQLRNRLSYYLKQVRRGIPVVVLDRGSPIAQLVSISSEGDLQGRIAKMVDEGLVAQSPMRAGARAPVAAVVLHGPGVQASTLVSRLRDEK